MIEKLLREIDSYIGRINTHPDYSEIIKRELMIQTRLEADKESAKLDEEDKEGYEEYSEKELKKLTLERIATAWETLTSQGITLTSLTQLGTILAPERNKFGMTFRNQQIKFNDFFEPPLARTTTGEIAPGYETTRIINSLMDQLVYKLDSFSGDPISKATSAHLNLVEIHPFLDGNGKAARLLQNYCLTQSGLPPAIIPKTERELYLGLMNTAIAERHPDHKHFQGAIQKKPGPAENNLIYYIGSKVLGSLINIENRLKKIRIYSVNISNFKNQSIPHSVRKAIHNYGRNKNNEGVSVVSSKNCLKKNTFKLDIRGDITPEKLIEIMDRQEKKYGLKAEIYDHNNKRLYSSK